MAFIIVAAWTLTKILSYGALVVLLAGVGVFGWHFVRINGASGRTDATEVPTESWRGAGAKLGYQLILGGFAFVIFSIGLASVLPNRT